MNNRNKENTMTHNFVVGILMITSIGVIIEGVAMGWEFWVPPLIAAGLIAMFVMHILQYRQRSFRENFYFVFAMIIAFYHGVHVTSFLDIVVVSALLMVTFSLLLRQELLTFILTEFFLLIIMQIVLGLKNDPASFDTFTVMKLVLHCIAEICGFVALREAIRMSRRDSEELEQRNIERLADKEDMEDFLVNISHELRTPVNVINGMSNLILKNEQREDVSSINDAGMRLAHQIEDIQYYSELQRGDLILADEKYMITSLINDIILASGFYKKERNMDLVVDLDPSVPTMMQGDPARLSKITLHLLDNAFKFTKSGGVYLRVSTIRHDTVTNLVIEVKDTGIGMSEKEIDRINIGMYQSNRKRNRSTGGIGLGLPIVYGIVRCMNGFVSVKSRKNEGTSVCISIPQTVIDPAPCLRVDAGRFINAVHYLDQKFYTDTRSWEFYRTMVINTATDLRINLYYAPTIADLKRLIERGDITNIFMGEREYEADREYFDGISENITVAVCARDSFRPGSGNIAVIPRPLYGYSVVRILNGNFRRLREADNEEGRPVLDGVRALVVDDERMNLIVAKGLFGEYNMKVDTAMSGKEAIKKYMENEYDVVFMDHMMPEMDGVEAMKKIKEAAVQQGKAARVIALTANVVSGAREMFMREGFDGFIGKPIVISEFERTMNRVLPNGNAGKGGRT